MFLCLRVCMCRKGEQFNSQLIPRLWLGVSLTSTTRLKSGLGTLAKALSRNTLRWTTHTLFEQSFIKGGHLHSICQLSSLVSQGRKWEIEKRLKSLIFKVSHMWVFFFLMGVFERGEKRNGTQGGGMREGMGSEGDSAGSFFPVTLACYQTSQH